MRFLPVATTLMALGVPATFILFRLLVSERNPFRATDVATRIAAVLTLFLGLNPWTPAEPQAPLVHLGGATRTMLVLVGLLAFVIAQYSKSYLQGDPGAPRYARNLLSTLAAVTALLLTNNLLVLSFSWTAASLSLHQLLTFYPERPQAVLAAKKKFLLSRVADACMLSATALIAFSAGSLNLGAIESYVVARESLPGALHVAAVLIVFSVSLKSAQLPFHGWLTQVMEAPTPVSALLHAGVVNIGGFVLIRFAGLMAKAPFAAALLVCIGTWTAVLASLVMLTRVSVKVALAWSTCAQMGFMLVECGLGLWHIALVHLVAHSCYKAYAFLSAGDAVTVWRVRDAAPTTKALTLAHFLGAIAIIASVAAIVVAFLRVAPSRTPATLALVLFVCTALAPWLARMLATGRKGAVQAAAQALGITALYMVAHSFVARKLLDQVPDFTSTDRFAWSIAILGMVSRFAVQVLVQSYPRGKVAQSLHRYLFAGLYLDEAFTRATYRLWPRTPPRRAVRAADLRISTALGVRP